MKITVRMKDPDTMYDAVQEAVEDEVRGMGLADEEAQALIELRADTVRNKMRKWFEYGEYLAVEFDTNEMTATVLDA